MKALKVRRTEKAPETLVLGSEFKLPENRPRQQRRIPQLREYPPVVAELFRRSIDSRREKLRNGRFSFRDVEAAIEAVGANLHWTRADTFLDEIARSRNVRQLLGAPRTYSGR